MAAEPETPKGDQYLLTPEWKKMVDDRLKKLGKTRMWLADQVGARRSAVTKLLHPDRRTSSLVPAVCRALDLPMPQETLASPDEGELLERYRSLPKRFRKAMLDFARSLGEDDDAKGEG